MSLVGIGKQLRTAGMTPRALLAWAGTDRVSALPERIEDLAEREPVPAAIALSLFVAGRDINIDKARAALPVDELLAAELVVEDARPDAYEDRGRCVRATCAILPVGPSLVVCDRLDAPPTTERVVWPDDSSYHLASSLPAGRIERWLDLGCGSAFAPLARPELAASIAGVDLNPLAAQMARMGAELSGVGHIEIEHGDWSTAAAPAQLVTCNAPMPVRASIPGMEMWLHATPDVFERLWHVMPDRVAPGGLAVVHAAVAAIPHERLSGERILVEYTPAEAATAFCVMWWRPDAPERLERSRRALTTERPHLDASDFRA